MRALPAALVAVLLLAGCSATPLPEPTQVDDREAVLSALRDEVAAVGAGRGEADAAVNEVLEVVRAVNEAVAGLGNATTFDATLAAYEDDVHARVAAVEVDGLRDGYFAVAEDVDEARQTLASARQRLDDPWEATYLDAQDAVLLAVRDYAEVADRLAQLVVQHWPAYTDADGRIVDFAARRGNYRDTQEAFDALAVELDTVVDQLAVAEAQIAEYRGRRTAAGRAVNEASADAVDVYERRPSEAGG